MISGWHTISGCRNWAEKVQTCECWLRRAISIRRHLPSPGVAGRGLSREAGVSGGAGGVEGRKAERNYACHQPVREAAEALALGANTIRENLADIYPDDGTLRERKERYVSDQQPDEIFVVLVREEDGSDAGEASSRTDGA